MLSNDTEMKIIKLFLGIANGDKKIDNIKRSIVEKFPINPEELFFKIDSSLKGSITSDDLISYLSQFQVQCSQNEAKLIIFFYDANQDGQLDFFEFLNLLISDSDYLFKKICKKRFTKKNTLPPTTQEIEKAFVDLLINEIDFSRYMFELISDVKSNDDFSLQDLFYVIKSYSFITFESIKAFFDRNGINYSPSDIKSIFNRIDSNRDGKICFNELKSLFNISFNISCSGTFDTGIGRINVSASARKLLSFSNCSLMVLLFLISRQRTPRPFFVSISAR